MSLFGNSSMNVFGIGNAYNYAKSYVNSLKSDGKLNSAAAAINNTAQGTINNTASTNTSFSKQNTSNLSKLQSASAALSSAAKTLTTGAASLVSSNTGVVSSDTSLYSRSNTQYNVSVNRLATTQQSQSASFNSFAKSSFDTGKNSMRLLTERGSYDISFNVGARDNNQDALNNIAKSINSAQAGVTASVVSENGSSRLNLTSSTTGEMSAFALEDLNGSSAATTLNTQTTQRAQNASYSVNGKNYTSGENTVSVPEGRGAQMTLNGTGSAQLSRGVDATKVVSAANNFAAAYNNAMSYLTSGNSNGAGVSRALSLIANNRMTAMSVSNYGGGASSRLANMGITIDDQGKMQVDSKKLTAAAQKSPSSVQSALTGMGGLADTTRQNAEQALRIPKAQYTDFSKMGAENSLINAMMPKAGSIFDMLK